MILSNSLMDPLFEARLSPDLIKSLDSMFESKVEYRVGKRLLQDR